MRQGFREPLERIVTLVARDVEPLLDDLVFVGGVATALLITDRASATAPATDDVDVVVDAADDPLASRDLEDIVTLVSGRPEIVEEVADARPELRTWVARQTATFLDSEQAEYVLRGNLPDARTVPGLVETVRRRRERIAGIAG